LDSAAVEAATCAVRLPRSTWKSESNGSVAVAGSAVEDDVEVVPLRAIFALLPHLYKKQSIE
jgi:hypothetical protein